MEQNSFKKQLQQREIKPSKDSWNKLEEKLIAFENKKSRNKWNFLKYAAAILMLISVGIYFNQKEEKIEIIIVEEPVIKLNEIKKDLFKLVPEEVLVVVSNEKKVNQSEIKKVIVKSPKLHKSPKAVRNNNFKKEQHLVGNQILDLNIDSIHSKKIEEFVVLAQAIEKKNGEVSDLEIELLLEQAQKSLVRENKNFKKESFNGADLLAEIEYDLDKDFKARLFDAIVNTLKDPKKVFVNRDN